MKIRLVDTLNVPHKRWMKLSRLFGLILASLRKIASIGYAKVHQQMNIEH